MQHSCLIIKSDAKVQGLEKYLVTSEELFCLGVFNDYDEALNKILESKPDILFFQVSEKIPLSFLNEILEYVEELPYIVVLSHDTDLAFSCIKKGVSDYLLLPCKEIEIRKSYLKFINKNNPVEKKTICIKSSGDYHFITIDDIVYLKADNNTTDFFLKNGRTVTAFKTLKCFESQLPFYFLRIHNSYIVNSNFVSRINLGKSKCYLFNNEIVLSFSRTYKENIDALINRIAD